MRAALSIIFSMMIGAAYAQQPITLFHSSPDPWHTGTWGACGIACRKADMFKAYPPGSCVSGTFISADIQVLAQKNIRVRPDAEFWPHNGWDPRRDSMAIGHNPWNIDPYAIRFVVAEMPRKLANDIVARVGKTTDFQVYYTGDDLIHKFGFKPCVSGSGRPNE